MRVTLGLALLALAGCNAEGLAKTAYPGAQTFSYRSDAADSVNTYACQAQGPGGATPELRSKAMHRYFEAETKKFAEVQAEQIMKTMGGAGDTAVKAEAKRLDAATSAFADRTYNEGDKRFKCFLIETRDL